MTSPRDDFYTAGVWLSGGLLSPRDEKGAGGVPAFGPFIRRCDSRGSSRPFFIAMGQSGGIRVKIARRSAPRTSSRPGQGDAGEGV